MRCKQLPGSFNVEHRNKQIDKLYILPKLDIIGSVLTCIKNNNDLCPLESSALYFN